MRQSLVRVLVVDDFEPFRKWLCIKLKSAKYFKVIGEAADGLQAIQLAKKLLPDLILLDIGLPRMDGIETEKQLRRVLPTAKVLFVTAYPYRELVQSMSMGSSGFVLKQDAERDLLPAMNAMVRGLNKGLRAVDRQAEMPWPNFVFRDEVEVPKQVEAPAETRTPNLQRAKSSSMIAGGRMATVATGQEKPLDSGRPSHGRR